MNQDDYSVLPDNAMLLPSVHREGKDTIHVQVFQLSTDVVSEHRLIDTKCSVEPKYVGQACTLCGESYHNATHCRWRGYVTGPNGEPKVSLVNLTYFSDDRLDDKLALAVKGGFLRGTTEDEIQWVKRTIADLRETKRMLFKQNQEEIMDLTVARPHHIGKVK